MGVWVLLESPRLNEFKKKKKKGRMVKIHISASEGRRVLIFSLK